MKKIPELLAPAGDMDKLKVAVLYGADAVYLGDTRFSLRTRAGNFDQKGIAQAVSFAHGHGVRVYATVNVFAHGRDFAGLDDYLGFLAAAGVDGIIVADPGILSRARAVAPNLSLHLSTQANTTNIHSVLFWAEQGIGRVNLARELSLEEIGAICRGLEKQGRGTEVEVFVHGAVCISYSGRCLLSLAMTGRNANQGDCAQPCRYQYHLVEEKRPGEYYPVEEDARGTSIMNSRDLCLMERLPELVATGVGSLKIEGRIKSVYYLATVVRAYRVALDFLAASFGHDAGFPAAMPQAFMEELRKAGARGYGQGFAGMAGRPGKDDMLFHPEQESQTWGPAGIVRRGGAPPLVELRRSIKPGDRIQYLVPGELTNQELTVVGIRSQENTVLPHGCPGEVVALETTPHPVAWQEMTLLRRVP